MIEVLCIVEKTQERYRRLIPLGEIFTVVELPKTKTVIIKLYRKKRRGLKVVERWVTVAESFDEVKEKMKKAMNPFSSD